MGLYHLRALAVDWEGADGWVVVVTIRLRVCSRVGENNSRVSAGFLFLIVWVSTFMSCPSFSWEGISPICGDRKRTHAPRKVRGVAHAKGGQSHEAVHGGAAEEHDDRRRTSVVKKDARIGRKL